MAMMMARLYTGAHDLVTLRNAYHGLSGAPPPPAPQQQQPGGRLAGVRAHAAAADCMPRRGTTPPSAALRQASALPAAGAAASAGRDQLQQRLPLPSWLPPAEATMGLLGQHTWKYPVPQASTWLGRPCIAAGCLAPAACCHPTAAGAVLPAAARPLLPPAVLAIPPLSPPHASLPVAHLCCATTGACLPGWLAQPVVQGFGVHHALNPNPYRGVFGNDGAAYARDMDDLLKAATPGERDARRLRLLFLGGSWFQLQVRAAWST